MGTKRTRKTSRFVPRLVMKTAIAGVVPACAVGCGGSAGQPIGQGQQTPDAAMDSAFLGVAAVAFLGYDASGFVGEAGPGASDASPDSPFLGVAAVAYPAYEAGPPPATDAGATDAEPDAHHIVFVLAVTAYEVGRPNKG